MKTFSGCFNKAEFFREELKKGAPYSVFAIVAFVILSVVAFFVVGLLTMLFLDKEVAGTLLGTYFVLNIFTLVYNIVKAAFECFLDERQDLFDTLKKPE
jgi:uncharacterized membrane protein